MSALLDAVHKAAENRAGAQLIGREADADFRDALRQAHALDPETGKPYHSLSEIREAAGGITKQGVRWLIRREEKKP